MSKKKGHIPKRIAGVRLPKPLRSGLKALAAAEGGSEAIAEILAAASLALAARQNRTRTLVRRPPPRRAHKPKVEAPVHDLFSVVSP